VDPISLSLHLRFFKIGTMRYFSCPHSFSWFKSQYYFQARRFVPNMTVVKVHGNLNERDRILTNEQVLSGAFDIYLTTYETICSEEAFFTECFKFHTIVIDEGQRLKNANCNLCKSLERISSPFRLILTGTPLQNNLGELWALMKVCVEHYHIFCV
jgi:SNF2 family DNA or RNA helicase